jgi:hypothetical protein
MRRGLAALLVLFCGCAATGRAAADMEVSTQTNVVRVLECMRANTPDALVVNELRISPEEDKQILAPLTGQLHVSRTREGLRARLRVTSPGDLANTRYLLVEAQPEDEFYLFLPAVGSARKVTGSGEQGEIAGTRLSYADLRLINQAVGGAAVSLEAPTTVQGRAAYVLRFSTATSKYRRIFVSVDRETCATLRTDLHDGQGLAKRYQADALSLQRSGSYAYFERARIEDFRNKTRARVQLRGVSVGTAISKKLLDPKGFFKAD